MPEKEKQLDPAVKDITLLLLWLTSFEDDRNPSKNIKRSWKGYDFGVLGKLADENLVTNSFKAKSVVLTDEGIKRAQELQEKYLAKNA